MIGTDRAWCPAGPPNLISLRLIRTDVINAASHTLDRLRWRTQAELPQQDRQTRSHMYTWTYWLHRCTRVLRNIHRRSHNDYKAVHADCRSWLDLYLTCNKHNWLEDKFRTQACTYSRGNGAGTAESRGFPRDEINPSSTYRQQERFCLQLMERRDGKGEERYTSNI